VSRKAAGAVRLAEPPASSRAELEARIAALSGERDEAREQRQAALDILHAIAETPGDADATLRKIAAVTNRLFGAASTSFRIAEGDEIVLATGVGHGAEAVNAAVFDPAKPRVKIGSATLPGMVIRDNRQIHLPDLDDLPPEYAHWPGPPVLRAAGVRTLVGTPLRRGGRAIGALIVHRDELRPFDPDELDLLQSFADQAVIAIENARLITETREALEQQTATAEVLAVINASPGHLDPVFDAILEKAMRQCGAAFGTLFAADHDIGRLIASKNVPEHFAEHLIRNGIKLKTILGPDFRNGSLVAIEDLASSAPYHEGVPIARAAVDLGGIRSFLVVPLVKDGSLTGIFAIYRQEVRPFTDREIVLVKSFTDQAVIAMENARLLGEIRAARDAAEGALRELKLAQANLIQAEKMASLGQLTAGIAHEIKNPLNFVNNFATLSNELLDELKEIAAPGFEALPGDARADVDETMAMLSGNLDKIAEHGRRADGIVKSMLAHSRGSSGERQRVDLNALAEEALNLAYHGARAQDQTFNITLERDFAAGIAPIEVAPQDVTRVLLNLIGNGFHAAHKRLKDGGDSAFKPLLRVATRELGDGVEVRVRDNGTGIPAEIRDKLFQPFFTTKPTGEGTGLGLSISYDIVTQQHGGTVTVESDLGVFTEFTVRLPRQGAVSVGEARTKGRGV
jgi:signal transduction histidine kinase